MHHALLLAALLQSDDLSAALKKSPASYAFTSETKVDGKGKLARAGTVQGTFEREKPIQLKAGALEAFRRFGALVWKDGAEWKRVGGKKEEKGKEGPEELALVQSFRMPHEEIEMLDGKIGQPEKSADGDRALYSGTLAADAARSLATGTGKQPKAADLTYSGRACVWVGADQAIVKYELTITAKGTVKEKTVEWTIVRTVELRDVGAAKVAVPEEAQKLLEKP